MFIYFPNFQNPIIFNNINPNSNHMYILYLSISALYENTVRLYKQITIGVCMVFILNYKGPR